MRFTPFRPAATGLLAVLTLLGTTTAYAQVTITASPSGPNPGVAGTGLTGQYYGKPGVGTNAAADAFIGSNGATRNVDCTGVDNTACITCFISGDGAVTDDKIFSIDTCARIAAISRNTALVNRYLISKNAAAARIVTKCFIA